MVYHGISPRSIKSLLQNLPFSICERLTFSSRFAAAEIVSVAIHIFIIRFNDRFSHLGHEQIARGYNNVGVEHMILIQFQISIKIERKNENIFLPIDFNICFGCSNEPSQ